MPIQSTPILSDTCFDDLRHLVYQLAGIALGDNKKNLVTSRLLRRLRECQLSSFEAYHDLLQARPEEIHHFLDALSTNVTSFFRERDHFDFLLEEMRRWRASGQRRFRCWSAACSTGQEPYTLAMVLDEAIDDGIDLRILATDINRQVLQHARVGRYNDEEIAQIPAAYRHRFIDDHRADEGLRSLISFQHLNLAHPPFPMQGPMDAILCRNVLIYFDADLRKRLVDEFRRLLRPNGLLIVGHAEGMANDVAGFATLRPSVYRWLGRSAT